MAALVAMLLVAPNVAGTPGDPTPPVITNTIFGTLGANGWYISTVTINWHIVDPEGLTSTNCQAARTLSADTPGIELVCEATSDGGTTVQRKTFRIDKTPPSVATALERGADANGWYNRPFVVAFVGSDATSGTTACTSTRYSGPDNSAAIASGSCSDVAGNVTPASFAFKYDTTPPTLFAVTAKAGNRSAQIAWRKSTDTQVVEVTRAPGRDGAGESMVYRGSETGFRDTGLAVGRTYEYRVTGFDEALNRAEHKIELVATGPLLSPTPGARVTIPPRLTWTPVKKATYYNVQIVRGRRVLSAWPARPSYQLPRTWVYKGRRYRLRPGTYRWYVWPGFGRLSDARYWRRPLGGSTFVVTG